LEIASDDIGQILNQEEQEDTAPNADDNYSPPSLGINFDEDSSNKPEAEQTLKPLSLFEQL
jgi:hypothetical protein